MLYKQIELSVEAKADSEALLAMAVLKHHQSFCTVLFLFIISTRCEEMKKEIELRKCCPLGQDYVNSTCRNVDRNFKVNLRNEYHLKKFRLVIGKECPNGTALILCMASGLELKCRLNVQNGSLVLTTGYSTSSVIVPPENFCLDYINQDETGISSLVCMPIMEPVKYHENISCGMIISMPFLLVTFLVYLLLPDRNLHQKALMFYVLSLLSAYILLVTINLRENFENPWCSIAGYATLFSFLVSFFWMNVICFDIWYTFSGGRGFAGSKKSSERKRLIVYGVYAFGMPLLLLVLIYILDIYLPEDSVHRPDIGRTKCFISDGWANLWYFYGEAGILVLANIIFFALTALKIRKVKQETSMLKHSDSKRHSYEKDKQKFNLYVKLLFAMGVNWSMEVISWLVNWQTEANIQYIFYITDFFNAVYGVWIFFIFVFKRKIWMLLKKRFNWAQSQETVHTGSSSVPSSVSNIKAASP